MKKTTVSFKYDIYIGYSIKDTESVLELAQRLRNDNFTVWFDKWELEEGNDIENKINEGLIFSRIFLLVMSKNLFKENLSLLEKQTLLFRDSIDNHRKFIPILIGNCEISNTFKQYAFIDFRYKSAHKYSKIISACQQKESIKTKQTKIKPTQIFKGHTELVRRAVISSSGKIAITSSNDKTLRIWNVDTGKCDNILADHKNIIWAITFIDNESKIVSGSHDNTIRVWNLKSGLCIKTISYSNSAIIDLSVSQNGKIMASLHDNGIINIWSLKDYSFITSLNGNYKCKSINLSSDGKKIIVGSPDFAIKIWDTESKKLLHTLIGHNRSINSITITEDSKKIISGSSDSTIRIWDVNSGKCLALLEGHTDKVWSVVNTRDGKKIISGSGDKTIRIWDLSSGLCLNVLEGHYDSIYNVSTSADGSYIISAGKDMTVRIWNIIEDKNVTINDENNFRYTNAKVLIVGDTGVGKSGLAIRLTENKFENTISTDAVWATQLKLPYVDSSTKIQREIWLWDFAGQPDYRLVHQLFMDETSLAILVFNPQDDNPYEGLGQWTYELQRAARIPFKKLLVAGRCDRGGLTTSKKRLDDFINQNGFDGFFETSANTGIGCDDLYHAIVDEIDWDNIPWTSSPRIFHLLKKEIIRLKDEGKVLLRLSELKQQLEIRLKNELFSIEELITVIRLLAGPCIVWQLEFGDFILLRPEHINSYAAAVIRKVRGNSEEIGTISEEDTLEGRLDYQDMARLPQIEEQIVLRAMHQTFINHGLCLREQTEDGTLLIFPSYFKRERSISQQHPPIFITYSINGNLDNIYSTLIVKLHHIKAFQRSNLWRFAAEFKTERGQKIGLKLTKLNEGNGEIAVYFDPKISDDTKVTFIRYVHEHLKVKTIDIVRLRHYVCPYCETPVENRGTALERLKNGKKDILCVSCEERVSLWDLIEEKFASIELRDEILQLENRVQESIDNESRELILIGHAFAIAGEAGQIFRPTANSDWGIDGEIEFKDDRGEATGERLYLQLKSGDSYLRKRKTDGKEIFSIKKSRHAIYWKSQAYPVMLVVRTSDDRIRWMNISEYLNKRKTNKKQVIFNGELFNAINLVKMKDKVLNKKTKL